MYAVVRTGGRQWRVQVGQLLDVDSLSVEAGTDIELDEVLLVGGEGAAMRVGTPTVDGAKVVATVLEHHRGEKLVIFKMKPKKRYRRKTGHRQNLTRLQIKEIVA